MYIYSLFFSTRTLNCITMCMRLPYNGFFMYLFVVLWLHDSPVCGCHLVAAVCTSCDLFWRHYSPFAIWRLQYVSLVFCCDVSSRLLTQFLLAGSLYRRNIRRWHVKSNVVNTPLCSFAATYCIISTAGKSDNLFTYRIINWQHISLTCNYLQITNSFIAFIWMRC